MKGLKRYFITGLLVVVPLYITVYVFLILARAMDGVFNILPEPLRPQTLLPYHIPGIGIVFTLLGILLVGLLTQNFAGKKLVALGERLLTRIPFLRMVYNATKQFMETFLSSEHEGFRKVVIIEYPRKGVYAMGFVTGRTRGELSDKTAGNTTSIFIPTTPNPTSGFYAIVQDEEIIPLEMTVEDAFKVIMTGGIVVPETYGARVGSPTKTAPPVGKD